MSADRLVLVKAREPAEFYWSISGYLSSAPGSSGRDLHFRIAIFAVPDFAGNHIQFAVKVLVLPLLVYHSSFPTGIKLEKGDGWLE